MCGSSSAGLGDAPWGVDGVLSCPRAWRWRSCVSPGGCKWGLGAEVGLGETKRLGGGREHQLAGCVVAPCSVGTPAEKLPQERGWHGVSP